MKHRGADTQQSFGVYIHWPYCESKCPYCDFNSHVAGGIDQDRWAVAYEAEIHRIAAETGGRLLTSVFFGGGTPSLMQPSLVDRVVRSVRSAWRQTNDVEITLEANPGSVDQGRFEGYRDAGVNRISIGVQSLDDRALRKLGRRHSAEDAVRAVEIARNLFDRVSVDLIYARQDQTLPEWEGELQRALDLGTDHISLYQLTVEDGTVFAQRHREGKLRGLPDEDLGADMYLRTLALCAQHGLIAYEVSNLAREGAESRHNLTYWRGQEYAGVGPGAHGRLHLGGSRIATESHKSPQVWLESVERTGSGFCLREPLTPKDALSERLLMGLRLSEGLEMDDLTALGLSAAQVETIAELQRHGLLVIQDGRLMTSAKGRLLLDSVLLALA